ncbi:hypothetical protein Mal64_13730 [Pseudobythopirellula maris]|uniref:FG-GAP repeat protein n=1 Tax=Pseudobythopirellula maris TaxID=2527991 RepID=A0A5C5ZTT3_9BACT|nr:hypothetical protein [Pseudobythopirellula maris]TWT90974.1 hypothetical protein Mal64_13730 [Pseudobythopirellula maris]
MNSTHYTLALLLLVATRIVLAATRSAAAGPIASFDDIEFWIGEGPSRAAIALDWDGQSETDNALVWGYRWSGTKQLSEALLEVVAADERLFARVGQEGIFGLALYGMGYDANGDGQFAIDDGSQFDSSGVLSSERPMDNIEIVPPVLSIDPADRYVEGWFQGFWHHGAAPASASADPHWPAPTEFSPGIGLGHRTLQDGGWESLAFTRGEEGVALENSDPVYAFAPLAAEPPPLVGDYNRDGHVDAADFTVWRDALDQPVAAPGDGADGDRDGFVDADDYGVWVAHFGDSRLAMSHASAHALSAATPEPSSAAILITAYCFLPPLRRRY